MAKSLRVSIDADLYKALVLLSETEGISVTQLLRAAIHDLDADWSTVKPKYLNADGKTVPALSVEKMKG